MTRRKFALTALALTPAAASAFCGFYVAQADASLFNEASKVVLARDGNHTTMTMANDYQGSLLDFAMVIPVPVAIRKDQVKVTEMSLVDQLDAYSAPRLTEYFDADPCPEVRPEYEARGLMEDAAAPTAVAKSGAAGLARRDLGVRVEATYTVGEYDIQILSAEYSAGLETWLRQEGYRIPDGAGPILGSYIRQNMRFFVAKVNLAEARRTGSDYLRPLQISYDSPKFMLPIRLGMVNSRGTQDLLIYTLTPRGRVETTNYRTVRLPTGKNLPEFVTTEFGSFYTALFDHQVARNRYESVFTEYAWPLTVSCDPCSSDPIPPDSLGRLGAGWLGDTSRYGGGPSAGFLTRLHVRYDLAHFPEDLVFQETGDSTPWQAIYTIHHPFTGDTSCPAGRRYEADLARRQDEEVANLRDLTGWNTAGIWPRVDGRRESPEPTRDGGFWDWR